MTRLDDTPVPDYANRLRLDGRRLVVIGAGQGIGRQASHALAANGARLVLGEVRADDAKALQSMGDALREQLTSGVGLLAARLGDGKGSLLAVVTDDLRARGLRADTIVRDVAAIAGGRGGGKPHMAQAGIPDAERIGAALSEAPKVVAALLASA